MTPASELRDGAYVLGAMSEEKAGVAFAFENTVPRMVPTFEHVVKMYESEVFAFGRLATVLVAVNVCINALLVLAIAFFILRALLRVIRTMQVHPPPPAPAPAHALQRQSVSMARAALLLCAAARARARAR